MTSQSFQVAGVYTQFFRTVPPGKDLGRTLGLGLAPREKLAKPGAPIGHLLRLYFAFIEEIRALLAFSFLSVTRLPAQIVYAPAQLESVFVAPPGAQSSL